MHAATPWRWLCAIALAAAVIPTAWFGDDCLITFRTVENLLHGHGLCWNTADRVMTNTHPLWVFLVAGARATSGEFYWSVLVLSALLSAAAFALLLLIAGRQVAPTVFAGLLLACSRSFTDYCTSGLESPASHALLLGFAAVWLRCGEPRRRLQWCALLAGLACTNRIDIGLACTPVLLAAARPLGVRTALPPLLLGLLPFWGWLLFAAFYFGTPWPTPAYAKAFATGLPALELLRQGGHYAVDLATRDPLTAVTLVAGCGLVLQRRVPACRPLALGCLLHCLYVLKVGGDFMAGRFFTAPFVLAAAALVHAVAAAPARLGITACVAAAALACVPGLPPPLAGTRIAPQPAPNELPHGIGDERAFYDPYYGLLDSPRLLPEAGLFTRVRRAAGDVRPFVEIFTVVGQRGLLAGELVHIVDPYLCDPLLVRLPLAATERQHWRIGHFRRRLPEGYLETLATGRDCIVHPRLARYAAALSTITRAPLWSADRLRALLAFWSGAYDDDLRAYVQEAYDAPPLVAVDAAELAGTVADGTHWSHCPTPRVIREGGLLVRFPASASAQRVLLAIDGGDTYQLQFLNGDVAVGEAALASNGSVAQGIENRTLPAPAAPFDRIRITATAGAGDIAAVVSLRRE